MRALLIALSCTSVLSVATAATAETTVIHAIEGRFGVSYSSDPNVQRGGLQSLYEGRYTTSFLHSADNGLQFRFDIGIVVGNLDPDRPGSASRTSDRQTRF